MMCSSRYDELSWRACCRLPGPVDLFLLLLRCGAIGEAPGHIWHPLFSAVRPFGDALASRFATPLEINGVLWRPRTEAETLAKVSIPPSLHKAQCLYFFVVGRSNQ